MKASHRVMRSLAPVIPKGLKDAVRARLSLQDYDYAQEREANPYRDMLTASFDGSPYKLAIIEDMTQDHQHYVAACREKGVSYEVVDLLSDTWVKRLREGGFSAVLVWPSCASTTAKNAFDYRLHILEHDLGMTVYPTWKECWLTEHKPRLRDWLDAHQLPHPQTWVFHDQSEALAFAQDCPLPMVVKTATGAGATGVSVVATRKGLVRIINHAFGRGLRPQRYDARDRQRGFIYLQEYLPHVEEWRMVRIGDSYFGYRKEKGPDGLHSASHKWSWLDPGEELLNLLKDVTDIGGFTSMDVDVFRTPDGRLLINELQTVFGCTTPDIYMKVDGIEGRYVWAGGAWRFEPGSYWANHMCNLRVEHLMKEMDAAPREIAG